MSAKDRKGARKGRAAPMWTYMAGALVGIGGLAWAVVSYFIPRPEAIRPVSPVVVQQRATASSATAVNATDAASVFIGNAVPGEQQAAQSGPAVPEARREATPASQSASASDGGVAVNAAGTARVGVTTRPPPSR
jgi:hypothetical protein